MSGKTCLKVRKRGRCEKCGVKLNYRKHEGDIHHIVPMSKGGTNRYSNLVLLCDKCHDHIHEY